MVADYKGKNFTPFGARMLLQRLEALTKEIQGTREGKDIEALHRMRVASRRLRAGLSLFKKHHLSTKKLKLWRREIRSITQALGDARDIDVQIAFLERWESEHQNQKYHPGIARLRLRLQQQRQRLQKPLLQAIDHFEASGLINDMQETLHKEGLVRSHLQGGKRQTSEFFGYASANINRRLEKVLVYEPFVNRPECRQQHHAMRIRAKRLRYTLEFFAPAFDGALDFYIKQIKQIQSALGAIRDCDVWIEFIPQFIDKERQRTREYFGHNRPFNRLLPGLEYLKNERAATRRELYEAFSQAWYQKRKKHLFENLYATVSKAGAMEQSNL